MSCTPEKNKRKFNDPLRDISLAEAKAYAAWLSERTDKTYRLPTSSEWKYAANADGKQPEKDFNCGVTDEDSEGTAIQSVKSGKSNGWGLKNYIGNVQEWVVESSGKILALGGHYKVDHKECDISYSVEHNGEADDMTGFRVLREM